MLSLDAARDKAAALVELACRKGADAADSVYAGERSQGVSVRLGNLEDVHRSEGEEVGLRVFVGRRNATVASSDLSKDALETLADRALAMAAKAPEDRYAGLRAWLPTIGFSEASPTIWTSMTAAIRIQPT
jgi:PmbA protein